MHRLRFRQFNVSTSGLLHKTKMAPDWVPFLFWYRQKRADAAYESRKVQRELFPRGGGQARTWRYFAHVPKSTAAAALFCCRQKARLRFAVAAVRRRGCKAVAQSVLTPSAKSLVDLLHLTHFTPIFLT